MTPDEGRAAVKAAMSECIAAWARFEMHLLEAPRLPVTGEPMTFTFRATEDDDG